MDAAWPAVGTTVTHTAHGTTGELPGPVAVAVMRDGYYFAEGKWWLDSGSLFEELHSFPTVAALVEWLAEVGASAYDGLGQSDGALDPWGSWRTPVLSTQAGSPYPREVLTIHRYAPTTVAEWFRVRREAAHLLQPTAQPWEQLESDPVPVG